MCQLHNDRKTPRRHPFFIFDLALNQNVCINRVALGSSMRPNYHKLRFYSCTIVASVYSGHFRLPFAVWLVNSVETWNRCDVAVARLERMHRVVGSRCWIASADMEREHQLRGSLNCGKDVAVADLRAGSGLFRQLGKVGAFWCHASHENSVIINEYGVHHFLIW